MKIELTLNTDLPLYLYDKNGKEIYFKDSEGYWSEKKYDEKGNLIYFKNSRGYWSEKKYDENSKDIYFKDSDGVVRGIDPDAKVELTLDEIAEKLGIDVSNLKIKK